MLAPSFIDQASYQSVFVLKVRSAIDQEDRIGSIGVRSRKLAAEDDLSFGYSVTEHTDTYITLQLDFDDKGGLSQTNYGYDDFRLEIINPGFFLSA